MKLNGKDPERTVTVDQQQGGFMLRERNRYIPYGYQKAKWEESRIWLSVDEISKLAKFAADAEEKEAEELAK